MALGSEEFPVLRIRAMSCLEGAVREVGPGRQSETLHVSGKTRFRRRRATMGSDTPVHCPFGRRARREG